MGKLILGGPLLLVAFVLWTTNATLRTQGTRGAAGTVLKTLALALFAVGAPIVVGSAAVVIEPGQVGMRHAFGTVSQRPLLPGIRSVGMTIDVELRWPIDPMTAPRLFTEIGDEYQIHNGVRDEMVQFTINDIARTSNNLVVPVPTEGGIPPLDLNALRRTIRETPR